MRVSKSFGLGIIVSGVGAAIYVNLFILLIYIEILEASDFKIFDSEIVKTFFLAIGVILFVTSFIFLFILYSDATTRGWGGSVSNRILFQRILFSTFPIGNVLYYFRLLREPNRKSFTLVRNGASSFKKCVFDTLANGTVILAILTVLSFINTLFSPIIFHPFPAKMLFFTKLSFGFLIATGLVLGCFYTSMVIDVSKKSLKEPERIPADLQYFPDPLMPGRGTFSYYFKVLMKELISKGQEGT